MSFKSGPRSKAGAITNPATLAAVLLLLLNDHILRVHYPSDLTGKIGDFAWVFLAALALSWVLSAILPARLRGLQDWAAVPGFAVPAIVFLLGKSQPAFHAWLNAIYHRVIGIPSAMLLDRTDLIALAALVPAWIVWKNAQSLALPLRRAHLPILCLFGVLTVANAAVPDRGITRLGLDEQGILGQSPFACFLSTDGGLTWSSVRPEPCFVESDLDPQPVVDHADPDTLWRFHPGEPIELSTDGGATWTPEYIPPVVGEAEQVYQRRISSGGWASGQGPFDALVDPETGHVVFAMGTQGVLVRVNPSEWIRIDVGEYAHRSLASDGGQVFLVIGEFLLGFNAGLLVLSVLSLRGSRRWFPVTVTAVTAALWLAVLIVLSPALLSADVYAWPIPFMAIALITVICVVSAAVAAFRLQRQSTRVLVRAALVAGALMLLFPIPYLLWTYDVIHDYFNAMVVAVLLTGVAAVFGMRWVFPGRSAATLDVG